MMHEPTEGNSEDNDSSELSGHQPEDDKEKDSNSDPGSELGESDSLAHSNINGRENIELPGRAGQDPTTENDGPDESHKEPVPVFEESIQDPDDEETEEQELAREARWKKQWSLNDKIKEYFKVASGISANDFLRLFNVEHLHDFVHHELKHERHNPIHADHIVSSQKEFMNLLNKNVQLFLDANPSIEEIVKFLSIPLELKLTPESLRDYPGLGDLDKEDPHGMTDYYWNKAANFVYRAVIPEVTKVQDLIALVNVDYPQSEGTDFEDPRYTAMHLAVERGFKIGGEDMSWMHQLRGFNDALNTKNVENYFGLLRETILDLEPEYQNDRARTARVVKILCGNYLQHRLISGTEGGNTFRNQWDEMLRQPMLNEDPEDSVRHELRWQREFLFKYVMGRQEAGVQLPAPQNNSDLKVFCSVAEKSGYQVSLDGQLTLTPHSIEDYGTSLWAIARNIRKRLRNAHYESAADFVSHFDPDRLPRITEIPYREYSEASEAKKREWELEKLLGVVFFEELVRQLPRFHELNPSAREVRSLLELHTKVRGDIRYNPDAADAHDKMMWDLFDRYLGEAKTIQDWTTVATYRTLGTCEFEAQQGAAFNKHFWRAVELGDQSLIWLAQDVWDNNMRVTQFNATNTIKTAFEDLSQSERTDTNMIQRAVSLIQGNFLREQAKEKLADDPGNNIKVAIAAGMFGIPADNFDPKYVDPQQLEKVERYQKRTMLKYLAARLAAGVEITVPHGVLLSFIENANRLGFKVAPLKNVSDGVRVNVSPIPEARHPLLQVFRFGKTGVLTVLRTLGRANRTRKRGWW